MSDRPEGWGLAPLWDHECALREEARRAVAEEVYRRILEDGVGVILLPAVPAPWQGSNRGVPFVGWMGKYEFQIEQAYNLGGRPSPRGSADMWVGGQVRLLNLQEEDQVCAT